MDLARRHQSRLTALYVNERTPSQLHEQAVVELSRGSPDSIAWTRQHIQQSIDGAADRLFASLERAKDEYGLQVQWLRLDGVGSILVPQYARFADLCILSEEVSAVTPDTGYTFSEELLFVTGRPVVFIPATGSFETIGRHILIAWNSSRAATRAVNDALPLIERADKVTVLAINAASFAEHYGALPPERMVEHLRRHGAPVEAVRIDNIPKASISHAILTEAQRLNADLIVSGAYGQPKLWEKIVGGVTRDLLAGMTIPILMAH
jgi:nucleotide-binding universal stress UspA family protein